MLRQETDHRDRDAVAHEAIGVVGIAGELVIVGQPHQPRGLTRRQKPRSHPSGFNDHDRLTTGPAARNPEASGDVVVVNFPARDLVRLIAGAAVEAFDHPLASALCLPSRTRAASSAFELIFRFIIPRAGQGSARFRPNILDRVRAADLERDEVVQGVGHPVRARDVVAFEDPICAVAIPITEVSRPPAQMVAASVVRIAPGVSEGSG